MKQKLFFLVMLLLSVALLGQGRSLQYGGGYNDCKSLAAAYLDVVLKNDSAAISTKIIDKKFMLQMSDCGKKSGNKEAIFADSVMRNDYGKFFRMYTVAFSNVEEKIKKENISSWKLDSVKLGGIMEKPCDGIIGRMLTVYFTSNSKIYEFNFEVVEYKSKWYIIEVDQYLGGPYEKVGNSLIEH